MTGTSTIGGTLIQRKKPPDTPCPAFITLEGATARLDAFAEQSLENKEAGFNYLNKIFENFNLNDAKPSFRAYLSMIACGRGCAHKLSSEDAKAGQEMNAAQREEAVSHAKALAAQLGFGCAITCVSSRGSVYLRIEANKAVHTLRISDHIARDNGQGIAELTYYTWEPLDRIADWLRSI